ncbi:GMC family oxidoreductase [Chitiniphilus purpureus]|uniref:GMC family oxidoreductase n=1 Tax=Chitiniphilus purpureus TaxID=2981137 RepID=A0ABY6DRZ1_9NEIS|nr:GMC family oxidoreductase [Chitiniphilus sp. CD1]UXY17135.1 GMC family oxidoreductase [Chitiniphilus sp. CD1]
MAEQQNDEYVDGARPDSRIWDAVIVGAGAAGAVFANELTRAGLKVLMLEMGPRYQDHRSDFVENEMDMWKRVWSSSDYQVTGDGFSGAPNLGYGVGGGTLVWTAVALRMLDHDFRMRSEFGQPAGSTVEDWPVSLRELEPFYTEAERQMGVSGEVMPWDPPGRPALPNPPHPIYRSSALLQEGMRRLGVRSAPGPVAIASRAYRQQSACLHCGFCRSGCRVDAKYQCDKALIEQALATRRLKLVTGAVVTQILQGNSRRASGVRYIDSNTRATVNVRARVVIAANNPLELPRLFLNSANPFSPKGLGNYYDNVGRNFFSHLGTICTGEMGECVDTAIGFNMGNVLTLDFARPRAGANYIGGYAIESLNGAGAGVMAVDPFRGLWGSALKSAMNNYNRLLFTVTFCEGLPVSDNRITVDPNRRDAWGRPSANIHYQLHPNDHAVFTDAVATTRSILQAAGASNVASTDTPFDAHPAGTMRMGNDPRTSVTDRWGKVHGLDNVYVGGAALFVTGSSVNPTLTLHALAIRSARRIVKEFADLTAVQEAV